MSNPAAIQKSISLVPDGPMVRAHLVPVGTYTDSAGDHIIMQDLKSRQIIVDDSVRPIARWALARTIASAVVAGGNYSTQLAKLDRTVRHLLNQDAQLDVTVKRLIRQAPSDSERLPSISGKDHTFGDLFDM